MSDTIKGEVLVPASRFLPKCDCGVSEHWLLVDSAVQRFGDSLIVKSAVRCLQCETDYEQELVPPDMPVGYIPK